MGKGDIRTRRGKIVRGTFGNKRRHKRRKGGVKKGASNSSGGRN